MGEAIRNVLTPGRVWLARGIAMAADLVQIGLFPYFAEGVISPADAALDAVVAVVLVWLVGWHIAFVPTIVVEMLPVADLAPTWTLAVFIATRGRAKRAESIVAIEGNS
ncbi:MAG TPA: hypothetical protein VGI81_13285 [Tepidisphaeraceae bacterium]